MGGLLCVPTATFSDPLSDQVPLSQQQIEKTVKTCVRKVQEARWGAFEAFWNSASGRVENNAHLMPSLAPALFAFNKCMADLGVPLKYDK